MTTARSILTLGATIAFGLLSTSTQADENFNQHAIYRKNAPRPNQATPLATELPLKLTPGARIAFIGNGLFDRDLQFGYLETLIQQHAAGKNPVIRNLSWTADEITLQPRPDPVGGHSPSRHR